ncbi:MAG TPA: glycerol-3-phosphate responsive antiterminator [Halanaerobiales bacterium]|nr:glycerol-3-phosphate responsive antiterminator [Halanaerobiales bacterium]
MEHLRHYFEKKPIIAGLRGNKFLKQAVKSDVIALFILYGDIFDLPLIMEKARKNDKLVFLHIDLIDGIGRDKKGIKYLAVKELCDGIVTTKSNLIFAAKNEGLTAIQRLFLLDSAALKTGEHLLENNKPDAVEILPGLAAPYFLKHVNERLSCPVIAGGLITKQQEVEDLINNNIMAVSTSNQELWS